MNSLPFIVFEGIDGSGKTTQLNEVYKYFKDYPIIKTYEPSNSPYGQLFRKKLLNHNLNPNIALKLLKKDRLYHIKHTILPNYRKKIILQDRYFYSTIAYQMAQGIDYQTIIKYFDVKNIIKPDLVFFIDVSPDICLTRLNRDKDQFEKKIFLQTVYNNYLSIIDEFNIIAIDGTDSIYTIANKIIEIIKTYLGKEDNKSI